MKTTSAVQGALFEEEPGYPGNQFSSFCEAIGVVAGDGWADRFGNGLRKWASGAIKKNIRTLSLFSGAGGLDIGFHDAGFSISQAVEIDARFAATLSANASVRQHLSGTEVVCQDIREFNAPPDMATDFIIGGPPCQSFSAAGRRAAGVAGTQDDRGLLFREYVRLLSTLKPTGFLFENVYGIAGAEGGKAWSEIQQAFATAGYTIESRILDAADYGVPQHRERMFIVGMRERSFLFPRPTHGPDSPDGQRAISASEAISGCLLTPAEKNASVGGRFGSLLSEIPAGLNYSFFTEEMKHPKPIFAWRSKFSDFLYKADPHTPIRTLKAQGGQYTGPFHWENRPFGLAELKRLQTIPDDYQIIGKRQLAMHQIGNSVPPQLARILALSILSQMFDVALPCELPTLRAHEKLGFRTRKRHLTAIYKAKAESAIGQSSKFKKNHDSKNRYRADLGSDFSWLIDSQDGDLTIETDIRTSKWIIDVAPAKGPTSPQPKFAIAITSNPARPWAIGEKVVFLQGHAETREVFVGVWKAFEAELVRAGVKADLVQLSEYYQYVPRFRGVMDQKNVRDPRWNVLHKIVSGIGTREIINETQLAMLWDIHPEKILELAIWLRSLGYEIRNNATNSQIPEGCYLLPYAFPTLTPFSVQLRKKMVAKSGD